MLGIRTLMITLRTRARSTRVNPSPICHSIQVRILHFSTGIEEVQQLVTQVIRGFTHQRLSVLHLFQTLAEYLRTVQREAVATTRLATATVRRSAMIVVIPSRVCLSPKHVR